MNCEDRDLLSICQCLMFLNSPEVVATILDGLLIASEVIFLLQERALFVLHPQIDFLTVVEYAN